MMYSPLYCMIIIQVWFLNPSQKQKIRSSMFGCFVSYINGTCQAETVVWSMYAEGEGNIRRSLKSCSTLIICLHMNMLDFSSHTAKLTKGSSRKVHIVSPLVSCYNNNLSLLPYFAVRKGPKDSRCMYRPMGP